MKRSELRQLIREILSERDPEVGYDGEQTLWAIKMYMDIHANNIADFKDMLRTAKGADRQTVLDMIKHEENSFKAFLSNYKRRTRGHG